MILDCPNLVEPKIHSNTPLPSVMSFYEHVRLAKASKGNNTYFPPREESKSDGHESPKDNDSEGKSDEESDLEVLTKEDSSLSDGESDVIDEIPTIVSQRYENLRAPILERWTKSEVKRFMENRLIYESQMREISGGKSRIFPLRLSLGDRMRFAFCRYILKKNFENVKDRDVSDAISNFLEVKVTGDVEEIHRRALKRHLKMRDELHPEERIFKFFKDYHAIVMEEGLEAFTEKHPQKAIKHLLEQVRPTMLRDALKGEILDRPEVEKDLTMFFECCEKHMKYLTPLLNYRKRRWEDSSQERETAEKDAKSSKKSQELSKKKGKGKTKNSMSGGHSTSKDGKTEEQNPKKNPKKKKGPVDLATMVCYNCGEKGHGSWKCPKRSTSKKVETAKKSQASRAEKDLASSSDAVNNSVKNKSFLTTPSQCLEGLMAFIIPVVFCLDTGATVSLIDKILAKRLRKSAGIKSTKIHFDLSITTVDENHKIVIKEKC